VGVGVVQLGEQLALEPLLLGLLAVDLLLEHLGRYREMLGDAGRCREI